MMGECPAFGVPAILVPYPHAWRYQKVNADFLSKRGAAVQLADESLMEEMAPTIVELLEDSSRLAKMSAAARAMDKPEAATDLARMIVTVGQRKAQGGNI